MPEANRTLQAALKYLKEYHYSVVPIPPEEKFPTTIKWEQYQKRLPSEEEVTSWWTQWPNFKVGIVTGIISGMCAIDTDDEEADKHFRSMLPDHIIMPTVTTPRGGKHYYFKCTDSKLRNKTKLLDKKLDFRGNGGLVVAPPSMNGNGKAYAFVKNLSIKEIALPVLPESITNILKEYSSSYRENVRNFVRSGLTTPNKTLQILTEGRRDEDLFHVADALVKTRTKLEEMWQVLEILAKNCIPPFPEKEIAIKIKSALARADRRDRNLADEVKNWVTLQNGYFSLTEAVNSLQLLTKEEKNNLYVIVQRLEKEGLIEKYGKKSGVYRKLETAIEEIDIFSQDEEEIHIKWPFEIEKLVRVMAKNIIIIAGTPNAGKTAFLLNVIEKNMGIYDIHYFISEMGKGELKTRLLKFDRPLKSWKFHSYERSGEFADVIKPNAINIIDFLEIYQEHYLIGQWIKDIYDKLNKGIAIIAIQKKPGASMGVGGLTTLEKARLYITMDASHILKIEKGKNWADEMINPNKMFVEFKLAQGCKFTNPTNWQKEKE